MGISIFLIFDSKHRLWVLGEAVLTCTHIKYIFFSNGFLSFVNVNKCCILHGRVLFILFE